MSGAIDGAAALTKAGAGTLQVNVPTNSYSGGTVVTGGVLEVTQTVAGNPLIPTAGLSPIGTGAITLNGGELRLTGLNPAANPVAGTGRLVTFGTNGGTFTMNRVVNGFQPATTTAGAAGTAVIRSLLFNSNNWATNDALNVNSGNLTGTGPIRYEFLDGSLLTLNNAQTVPMNLTFQGVDNGSAAANRLAITATGATAAAQSHNIGRFGIVNATMTFTNGLEFRNAVQVSEFNGAGTIDGDIIFRSQPNGTFVGFEARGTGTVGAYSPINLGIAVNVRTITIENNATMVLDSRFRQDAVNVGGVIVNARTVINGGGTMEFAQSSTTGAGVNETGFHQVNGAIRGTGGDASDGRVLLNLPNKTTNGTANGGVNWSAGAALEVNGTGNGGLRIEGPTANFTGFYTASRINAVTGTGGALTFAPTNNGLTLNLAPTAASTIKLGVGSAGAGAVTVNVGAAANDLANWGGLVVKGSSGGGSTVANLAFNQTFATTTLAGGQLVVPTGVTLTSPITVSGGTLGGTGTIAGAVTAASGGSIGPGASPGILTVNGNVTFNSGSTFAVELNGATAGNGAANHDRLVVNGNVVLGSATLLGTVGGGFIPTGSTQLFIIDNPGAGTTTGTFNGIAQDGIVNLGGTFTAQVSYTGNTGIDITGGNDVVLYNFTPVPEPATVLGLGALGLAGAGWLRRRYARA